MSHVAFEPKEGVEITGGSCAGVNGETIDFGAMLADTENGNVDGVIVTNDPVVVAVLDSQPDFKRAEVPDGFTPPPPPEPPKPQDLSEEALLKLSRHKLVEVGSDHGVSIEPQPTRAETVNVLRAALVEAGVLDENGNPTDKAEGE